MKEFLDFIATMAPILYSSYQYVSRVGLDGGQDPEIEKQLAMDYQLRVAQERTRREIERARQDDTPTDPGLG